MSSINPYESPLADGAEPIPAEPRRPKRMRAARIGPRYLAFNVDILISIALALLAGSLLPEDAPLLQFAAMTAAFLGYSFVMECFFSRTLGKLLAGVIVLQLDGTRITARQAAVRTLFRLLEVNPILLGALPGALCIIFSRRRQRMGDMVAGTVVVSVKQMRR